MPQALLELQFAEDYPDLQKFASNYGVIFTSTPPATPAIDPRTERRGLVDIGMQIQEYEADKQEMLKVLEGSPPSVRNRVISLWDKAIDNLINPR